MLISFHVLFSRPDFFVRNLCTLLFSFSSSLSAPYQSSSFVSFSPLLYITPFLLYITPFLLYITRLLLYITSLFWKPVEIVAHFTIQIMRFVRPFSTLLVHKKTAETFFAFSAVFLYSVQMQLENTSYCKDVSVICGRDLDTA